MRLAITNLLKNPPSEEVRQSLIIACKDDETFAKFLTNILEEAIPN